MTGRIRAVCFDLDGTLVDTFGLLVNAFGTALQARLGRLLTRQEVLAAFGPGAGTELTILAVLGGGEDPLSRTLFYRYYEEHHSEAVAFVGIFEMLQALKAAHLRLGLQTGKGRRSAKFTLDALGFSGFFDSVITGDDVRPKPDPEGIERLIKSFGVKASETLFVGDSASDLSAGRNAGTMTGAALWGGVFAEHGLTGNPDFAFAEPSDIVREVVGPA